jgi:hypothetical protein
VQYGPQGDRPTLGQPGRMKYNEESTDRLREKVGVVEARDAPGPLLGVQVEGMNALWCAQPRC